LCTTTPAEEQDRVFLVCYDADSRPAFDSLRHFADAITRHPDVDVFHQSSRFHLRSGAASHGGCATVAGAVADAGALRANRFVLAYEIPRLRNRSPEATSLRRRLHAGVYTHVTGHGLCLRLPLLIRLPLPARSPLEDMHYSFLLGSRAETLVPISSLDAAEVPASLSSQLEQAARWFAGPGRFARYLRDPRTEHGPHAWLQALSAAAICLDWLSCAVLPVALVPLVRRASPAARAAAGAFTAVYTAQLVTTDYFLNPLARPPERLRRLLGYPAACELFGIGGLLGAVRLLRGDGGAGKTERSP
jgi:hypothetical protein